jgi:hypothetical protein
MFSTQNSVATYWKIKLIINSYIFHYIKNNYYMNLEILKRKRFSLKKKQCKTTNESIKL